MRVIKSTAGHHNVLLGETDDFDEAVTIAREAGATGEPKSSSRHSWLFSGGPEDVGYWIEE